MARKNSKAVFSNFLNRMSDRDVTRKLKMSMAEISMIDQLTREKTKVIEETSTKLAEAKKLVEELQAELTDTQTILKSNKKRKKILTKEVNAMEKHLESKREATEKDAYVKRCVKYLVENGSCHIDKVSQHTRFDLTSLTEYSEENLETFSDDNIIQLAHLTRVCEIFDIFVEDGDTYLSEWECGSMYNPDNDYIYFSEKVDCNGNTSDLC